jgi:hypothetical protein
MINEHDITKSMLNKIRLIKENSEPQINNEDGVTENSTNEIVILKDGQEQSVEGSVSGYWSSDKESFMQTVSSDVSFISFSITPKSGVNEGDVKMSGILNAYDIGFTMNKNASLGLQITTVPENSQSTSVKIDENVMKTLNSLYKYYQNWYKDWSTKLNTENFTNVTNA